MTTKMFQILCVLLALGFTGFFVVVVVPPLIDNPDILGAFGAGFVNPYAAGYATDIFFCWAILAVWIIYEARTLAVKRGWVCLVIGIVPGVAVGFAAYLVIRSLQLREVATDG